nr:hypothetical protein [Tanacetum cinerariifolium]
MNTRNQAIVQDERVDIQNKKVRNNGQNVSRTADTQEDIAGNVNIQRDCLKPRVRDLKYFQDQMLLAKKDEARIILNEKQNDFGVLL